MNDFYLLISDEWDGSQVYDKPFTRFGSLPSESMQWPNLESGSLTLILSQLGDSN